MMAKMMKKLNELPESKLVELEICLQISARFMLYCGLGIFPGTIFI